MAEIDGQGRSADTATIVKLNLIRLIRRSNLAVLLQVRDGFEEGRMKPGFVVALCMLGCDDVGSRLFDYAESIKL